MAIRTALNSYSTCGCIINEQYDDAIPDDQKVFTVEHIEHRCARHEYIPGADTLLATIWEEDKRMQKAREYAEATSGKEIMWAFDNGGTMTIWWIGSSVPQATKTNIQNWCDANCVGLVVVQ